MNRSAEQDHPTHRFEVRVASTRPVRARGDDHDTRFTYEALQSWASQVRDGCVWLRVEHLEFLPPLGRWREAELRACDDGEHELFTVGAEIPHYVFTRPGMDALGPLDDFPTALAPSLTPSLSIDRRNYDWQKVAEIEREADCPIHVRERWAELPPLAFSLLVPVVWGATRFLGSFLDELGRGAGQALATKIAEWAKRSREPSRSLVFAVEFETPAGAHLRGYVIAPPSDVAGSIQRAMDEIEPLATVAGVQAVEEFLPGMVEAAFFFDGEQWRFGWWSDGERVISTSWFQEHQPDCHQVLGRPLFAKSLGESEPRPRASHP